MPKRKPSEPLPPKPKPRYDGPEIEILNPLQDDPNILDDFPEHARLIGCILAEWTQAEHKLVVALGAFIPGRGAYAIRSMLYTLTTSRPRLQLIQAGLAEITSPSPETKAALQDIAEEAEALLHLRNDLAHALFARATKNRLATFSYKRGQSTVVTVEQLKETYGRMTRFSRRAGDLLHNALAIRQMRRAGVPPFVVQQIGRLGSERAQTDPPPQEPPAPSEG